MRTSGSLQRWLPALAAAIPLIIVFISALSIPLAAAQSLDLSAAQTSSWIAALYGITGLLSLALTIRYRQPLIVTGNIFILIFIASLGDEIAYPELIGAAIVAGGAVLVITALGLMRRLAMLVPAPVVLGLLAGAIMPFVSDTFTLLGASPALIGGTVLAYFLSRYLLGNHVPPILPAMIAGLVIAAIDGQYGAIPDDLALRIPSATTPVFSLEGIATATPVFIVLLTIQSNLPSVIFLRTQGYDPPEQVINITSGVSTMLVSLFGVTGVSISLPSSSLVAGSIAGEVSVRHRSVYLVSGAAVLIGVLAGVAAELPAIIPLSLLLALAGLSLVDVLANTFQSITHGPLTLGPLFAFSIALSEMSLLGFGSFFWALVIGTTVSLLLERDGLRRLHDEAGT